MPGNLFGVDIQGIVARAIAGAGGLNAAVLTKTTGGERNAAAPTQREPVSTSPHSCQALIESRQIRRPDTGIAETAPVITIIGGSVSPPAEPEVNDRVTFNITGESYTLVSRIRVDPARAVYEFVAR
ncbi:MAG: hypothetical protein OXE76_04015 [Alphaproteobacteria bacterium]|nr:hypothetical protein [Alphaproteobacteria bacterium]